MWGDLLHETGDGCITLCAHHVAGFCPVPRLQCTHTVLALPPVEKRLLATRGLPNVTVEKRTCRSLAQLCRPNATIPDVAGHGVVEWTTES